MVSSQQGQAVTSTGESRVIGTPESYLVGQDSDVEPVLSVVIPTMNEEEGIGTCLDWVTEAVEELRVPTEIIVADSSTDRTPEIAEEQGAIVVEPDDTGYGYAYRYAFEQARGEYLVMGDADTTYDFSEIPRLLEHLKETNADMVMGSRLEGEIKPGAMPPLHQYIGNPLLTRFLNIFYDAGVSDAHSGFRVFTADALEAMNLKTDGMEFASEMIMEAGASDLDIEEVPITYHERKGEETLNSFRDGWRHVRFMLVNAPGYIFSIPGAGFSMLGLVVMLFALTNMPIQGVLLGANSMIVGSLLVMVGYQAVSLGVFSTVAGDPIQKPSAGVSAWIGENLTLERGATAGLLLFGLGAGYGSWLFGTWLQSGSVTTAFTVQAIAAFTGIVLGMQTIFSAFFLSMVE
ncbi:MULTISPECIES: glycosyltransferase family 2 protein [Salinibaculum]|uniref:glycosyltransferase family 2 protein n=1 Tax=Salinibaculum TaxID=2732368 RepID=UPI00361416E7